MKIFSLAYPAVTLMLAGCASFTPDGGLAPVNELLGQRISQSVQRDAADTASRQAQLATLLAQPLSADNAVRIALLNNKALQAALAELGVSEADLIQAGTMPNPRFSFGRLSGDSGVEIDRAVLFDLGALLTMPMRKAIEERRFQQVQLQTALQVVRLATDTRRAYFDAVAARQTVAYMEQVGQATQASAELAQRMARAGNWSKLDEAREQVFHAEVTAQVLRADHNATAARESLVRLLGLSDEHSTLKLPERLPDLPSQVQPVTDIETKALAQRLDVQAAKLETEATAKNLGLIRSTRFVNVLEAGYQNKSATGSSIADGYQVELSLPLFDWGSARNRRAEAIYMRSLQRTASVAVQARSEVRESYSAYRANFTIAHRYHDQIVPLRKRVSEEVLLRYNGMLASVFELLTDARAQIISINATIEAQRDFWIAESELQFALHGGSRSGFVSSLREPAGKLPAADSGAH